MDDSCGAAWRRLRDVASARDLKNIVVRQRTTSFVSHSSCWCVGGVAPVADADLGMPASIRLRDVVPDRLLNVCLASRHLSDVLEQHLCRRDDVGIGVRACGFHLFSNDLLPSLRLRARLQVFYCFHDATSASKTAPQERLQTLVSVCDCLGRCFASALREARGDCSQNCGCHWIHGIPLPPAARILGAAKRLR